MSDDGNENEEPTTSNRTPGFDATRTIRELPVVLGFALIGFIGSVVLFLYELPAILVAVFLTTGVASLVYGFLGGITGAKFNLGPLQVTGSLAALLGIAIAYSRV